MLDPYQEQIIEWLEENLSGVRIHEKLTEEGVKAGYSTIKDYIVQITPLEKRKISEEIKDIINLIDIEEEVRPIKYELEKKIKQPKVHTIREFPYCLFSVKELRNLLNF